MSEARVSQNPKSSSLNITDDARGRNIPGPGFVLAPVSRSFILCLVYAKRAISIANAMRVKTAAKNAVRLAMRVTVRCWLKPRRRAIKLNPAATGVTANPRVQEERTSSKLLLVGDWTPLVSCVSLGTGGVRE
jgi:hypothetical protein